MITSKQCAGMTIRSLDDVVSYLSTHLLPRTADDVDRVNLAKCVAVARAMAELEEDARVAVVKKDARLDDLVHEAELRYGV